MAWPPETVSIPEPSKASASLSPYPPRDHCQGPGQAPGLLRTGTSALANGGQPWSEGAACLPVTGWSPGMVVRSSLGSGGCGLASPQGLSTKLLPPHPPRPSEQHLWVSVLPEPRPKPAQG